MSHQIRCIILIIRIRYDLTVVLVWIICSPRQNIGGGFIAYKYARTSKYADVMSHCQYSLARMSL